MVQEKIADSYAPIRMLRLFVLETAWKIDNTSTQETRTDIAAVKYTMAKVLREVSFNALHILGSLGTTDLTPLQAMYAAAPTMGIADGVDEVHKATVARNVLKGYRPARGLLADRVLPGQAGGGPGEVRAAVPGRPRAAGPRRRLRQVLRRAGLTQTSDVSRRAAGSSSRSGTRRSRRPSPGSSSCGRPPGSGGSRRHGTGTSPLAAPGCRPARDRPGRRGHRRDAGW